MSIRSATTALAVGPAPAPAPEKNSRPTKSPSATTALSAPVDMGQRMGQRHQAGMDALEQPAVGLARQRDQLDAEAERRGMVDVDAGDVADALDRDLGEVDPRAEGERRQDAELVRGIDAVDVEAGIGLGKAQRPARRRALRRTTAAPPPSASGCSCRCR